MRITMALQCVESVQHDAANTCMAGDPNGRKSGLCGQKHVSPTEGNVRSSDRWKAKELINVCSDTRAVHRLHKPIPLVATATLCHCAFPLNTVVHIDVATGPPSKDSGTKPPSGMTQRWRGKRRHRDRPRPMGTATQDNTRQAAPAKPRLVKTRPACTGLYRPWHPIGSERAQQETSTGGQGRGGGEMGVERERELL